MPIDMARVYGIIDIMDWYNNHENILTLARHLVEDLDYNAEELLAVLEKPWHWEGEFKEATGAQPK